MSEEIQKMNPEIKRLWLEALRSGEYQQGRGLLNDGSRFCCLGVLCDLHAKSTGLTWVPILEERVLTYEGERYILPQPVRDWAGLKEPNPPVKECITGVAAMNDNGFPFPEIADAIEASL